MAKPRVSSGSGLTAGDAKLLRQCLAELELILEVPFMMGAHEADNGFALQRRLKARLEPEVPAKLLADATDYIRVFGPTIASARRNRKAREDAKARYDAADAARRAAHNQQVAARQAELERKQQEAVASTIAASRGKM